MEQKSEYEVLNSRDLSTLCEMVEGRLKSGWQTEGGVCVVQIYVGAYSYYQAVTR